MTLNYDKVAADLFAYSLCRHRDVEANDDALYKKTFCDVHKDFSVVVITHVTHVLTVHSYLLIGITEIAAEMFKK